MYALKMLSNGVLLTVLCIALSVSAVELKRDANEQEAFNEGCEKNQANLNICSGYDFKVQDAKLNALYKKQMARVKGTDDAKRLVNAQRAWLKFVDADCLYQTGPLEESGTIWPLQNNMCRTTHFAQRIQQLESFLECTQDGCIGH